MVEDAPSVTCSDSYTRSVFERASTRALPLVNRAAEHAPMATACCNACRACVTSNVLGLVTAGVLAVLAPLRRRR
jgi:hypothetical protein